MPINLRHVNRSNNDDEAQRSGIAATAGRWTDEGLPLSLRRKLLRKELEQFRSGAEREAAGAQNPPAGPGREPSRERSG